MDALIVNLDKSTDKAELKSMLEMIRRIVSVTNKITRSDIEEMADDPLCFLSVLMASRLVKKQP
jgi:methyl coenzyme M reductase subunit C-like uncharacterized protein (methanogenesis marker protein 7)